MFVFVWNIIGKSCKKIDFLSLVFVTDVMYNNILFISCHLFNGYCKTFYKEYFDSSENNHSQKK